MKNAAIIAGAAALLLACCAPSSTLTDSERELIGAPGHTMRVLDITNQADSLILRALSTDFSAADLQSAEFAALVQKMSATVQSPEQNGVGIAAPQVGINRRLVVVCRTDKPGQPFEPYANIRIEKYSDSQVDGREGCLSVPGKRGNVMRADSVVVSYTDPTTLQICRDTVAGYAARIFQHECDHLEGVIYTDKAYSLYMPQ